ncbi:hypothetical protein J5N97_004317 [Dioscorea zingiberensis]|uniref:Myb/SANT-like domain-containing protein n=1 Tax=Dioscorea zingiberensis TaxID=325984 RepID=A0A9D5D6C1_9LILI|nr:hypothetical protein J5N97_004317 [Dioscorea zingiberensis]
MDMDMTRNTGGSSSRSGPSKRGTPNKRWKPEYDNFFIPLLVEQANKGLKYDKTFKRPAFACAALAVNNHFNTNFTPENVENHYRTLKSRFSEIKKARDLSGAGWNDELKMIVLDPIVCKVYTDAHPAAKPYINKPIDNYEGLRIICGEDQATGSYATSIFSDFGPAGADDVDTDTAVPPAAEQSDDDVIGNFAPPAVDTPAGSTSVNRASLVARRARVQNDEVMVDLIKAVDHMADAIKNPSHWSELLYSRVMEVQGFIDRELEVVFDYLEEHEHEGRRFMAKRVDMRAAWIQRFLCPME